MVLHYVQSAGVMQLPDGGVLSVDFIVYTMASILKVNEEELRMLISQIVSLSDEKEQMNRFRKILEESKKRITEKGVPLNL